jgi:septal ring factor EnvC (AmiA/AmiB activator)
MHSERKIEEISRGVTSGSAERKGLTESEKHSIELKEVHEDWEQALRDIKEERIRHARKLAEVRAEIRAESRDAAELERKRCKAFEREIAEVEEIVEAREEPPPQCKRVPLRKTLTTW